MTQHERFRYKTLNELIDALDRLGINLPTSDDFNVFAQPLSIGRKTVPNRFATLPLEGLDSTNDGTPTDLTKRKYRRLASGGAGLIWFEACCVVPEGRSNPHQMMLTENNLDEFKIMLDECRKEAHQSMGNNHQPIFILQLTHSGRYSRPEGEFMPIIAHHSPPLDHLQKLPPNYPLISDESLDQLQDAYIRASKLAVTAGFDGVEIKACHRYLVSELLASYTRSNSRYGGPAFENRTRFLVDTHRRIAAELPGFIVTSRINAYDGIEYPYGWGVDKEDVKQPDLNEPVQLAKALKEQGAQCLIMSIGNAYTPHYHRPYDLPLKGRQFPDEHPLIGVNRLIQIAKELQSAHPELPLVGAGYSYLREFFPFFAAGMLKQKWISIIGLGRGALAYPEFAKDLLTKGTIESSKVCITCSKCSQLYVNGEKSGCVTRDAKIYGPIYRKTLKRE